MRLQYSWIRRNRRRVVNFSARKNGYSTFYSTENAVEPTHHFNAEHIETIEREITVGDFILSADSALYIVRDITDDIVGELIHINTHNSLVGRDEPNQHTIASISGLEDRLNNIVTLVDDESIEHTADNKAIQIKNFDTAELNQYPVKSDSGIDWQDIITTEDLDNKVQQASQYADASQTAANISGEFTQQVLNTKNEIDNKFWYGTMEEYNALTNVNPDTYYFIIDDGIPEKSPEIPATTYILAGDIHRINLTGSDGAYSSIDLFPDFPVYDSNKTYVPTLVADGSSYVLKWKIPVSEYDDSHILKS